MVLNGSSKPRLFLSYLNVSGLLTTEDALIIQFFSFSLFRLSLLKPSTFELRRFREARIRCSSFTSLRPFLSKSTQFSSLSFTHIYFCVRKIYSLYTPCKIILFVYNRPYGEGQLVAFTLSFINPKIYLN